MSGAITHNFNYYVTRLENLQARIQMTGTRAMRKGMDIFLGQCIRAYYEGRPGLNAPTGMLRRGWHISSWMGGDDSVVKLANSMKYARIHEKGGVIDHPGGTPYMPYHCAYEGKFIPLNKSWIGAPGVKLTKPHKITIPKRTDVLGEYGRTGYNIIKSQVETALQNILKA